MRRVMRQTLIASVAIATVGCQYSEPDRDERIETASDSEAAEDPRAVKEEVKIEPQDAESPLDDLAVIDRDAARRELNDEIKQLNAKIDEAAEELGRIGRDAGDELNEALAELRVDRDAIAEDIEDLRTASAEAVAVAVEAVRKGLDELGDALENLSAELKET